MESMYPAGPASVPAELTAPSVSYRRHAWLAMAGLLAFVLVYFALLAWFSWTAYRLFAGLGGDDVLLRLLAGGCAAFLAIFMAKALVFIKRGEAPDDLELKPEQQPELFAFLHRLADEAGAPRPHRVYLSPRVNAAVFYDLSLANLVLPSRKNLEIGLGLVNILNLGEFKAVLAHEFGHFAQRTMAVGRWVYIAQQIASHIIAKRDALDTFLRGISSIDLRIAWIGWLLQLIVWSIRSLVELMFRVVILAQRALSREMEYQADLVAASLTGSDALVNALHRLHAADDAWARALDFAAGQAGQGKPVKDVFVIQARIIERMRGVLADPLYGEPPAVPADQPDQHRVFRTELAQPPQMWATHPANADRENNVKRTYIAAGIDSRSALVLFRDVEGLKQEVSRKLFRGELPEAVAIDESLARVDEEFARPSLDRRYRGTYLGRSPFRHCREVGELYSAPGVVTDLQSEIAALYPAAHGDQLDRLRELEHERATLEALRAGHLTTTGGVVRWRGGEVRKRELPKVIADLDRELGPIRESVLEHDRRCRSLHAVAGKQLGNGWDAYLRSLAAMAHYAEHAEADLRDAQGLLANTVDIVTADRRVSASELKRLLRVANQLQQTLAAIHGHSTQVVLDVRVQSRLGTGWAEALGEFGLPPATEANINEWMRVIDGWTNAAASALSGLRRAALETLLEAEDEVARGLDDPGLLAGIAPIPLQSPAQYPLLLPGNERKRQTQLGWLDRFQVADGVLATIARLAVAGGIVGAVLFAGSSIGKTALTVYNGLSIPVQLDIDGVTTEVPSRGTASLSLPSDGKHRVQASTGSGVAIESFEAETVNGSSYAYNIASAAALVQWTATYGSVAAVPEKKLGAPRWIASEADYVFAEPPASISTKSGGGSKSVLSGYADAAPGNLLDAVSNEGERSAMIVAHSRWDSSDSRYFIDWLALASEQAGFGQLLAARLKESPQDVALRRFEQDSSRGVEHERICASHKATAAATPESSDWQYLALRCSDDGDVQDDGFLAAHAKWPENGWLALAAGYTLAERRQWGDALQRMETAAGKVPAASETLMVEIARLKRASHEGSASTLDELAKRSHYLSNLLALESGVGVENTPLAAYAAIARGELDKGLELAKGDPEVAHRVLWLAAASDLATPEIIRSALAVEPGSGIDELTVWPALALASRVGADRTLLLDKARNGGNEDAVAMLGFLEAVRSGADSATAESALGNVSARSRGTAYSMAVIMMGQRCPRQWREDAKQLLFGAERPYFN